MKRSLLLLVLALICMACEPPTDPNDPNGGGSSSTVTMTNLTDLPQVGGSVADIEIGTNNSLYLLIDGKLYSATSSGGAIQLINGDADHMAIGLAPSGELYAVMPTEYRVYNLSNGTFTTAPIDPAGPLAISRRVELVDITFSPTGDPYITLINNTPQTYVYYSTDKGAAWTSLNMPQGFQYGGSFTFAPNGDMLMSSTFGFYRSTDRGATWTTKSPARPGYGGTLLAAANGDIYHYPVGGGGLKVSRDGGASFTELTPFNNHPFLQTIRQGSDGALYALARTTTGYAFTRSSDGGTTWNQMTFAFGATFAMNGSYIAIGLGSIGHTVPRGGLMISSNSGSTWAPAGIEPVERIVDIGFDKDGNLMMLADEGLYRRVGNQWQTLGATFGGFGRFTSSSDGVFVLATSTAVRRSSDNGRTWSYELIEDYTPGIDPAGPTVLIPARDKDFLLSITSYSDARGYSNGHLYRIGVDGRPVRLRSATPTLVSIIKDHNGIFYGGSSYVDPISHTFVGSNYISSDGGNTWDESRQRGLFALSTFNSQERYLSQKESDFILRSMTDETGKKLTLEGFTSQPHYIRRGIFGPDDRLYLVTLDKGLFISSGPVR